MALGFELQVIGAVVLGGTNIFGGEGSFLGTVLGAFFLYFISQVLTYSGASPYSQDAITGAVIVLVIGLDCALHRRRKLLEDGFGSHRPPRDRREARCLIGCIRGMPATIHPNASDAGQAPVRQNRAFQ